MLKKIKQKILEKKYNKAKEIYIICFWYKYGVLPVKFYGFNKKNELLTIQYNDHNGQYEEYYIAPWYNESTGALFYCEQKKIAEIIKNRLNNYE